MQHESFEDDFALYFEHRAKRRGAVLEMQRDAA